ncbi:hypothetical protein CEQ90_13850 [Lewinellaceae bacterium SD302]|nr:hypothetical protein CEQ90_13850 [Lewinellaceae bacterium SD302]
MRISALSAIAGLLFIVLPLGAQEAPEADLSEIDSLMMLQYFAYVDSIENTLTFYSDTTIDLGAGLAELVIPPGYKYIDGEDGRTVLVDLWGNPPGNGTADLGMLFPIEYGPGDPEAYGIAISFTEDGYIEDDDARDMDYDDLLEQMQDDTDAENEMRLEAGYESIRLLGWATPPHYDEANKRLHWAKEIEFGETEGTTLNYNVLFLGRRGYLMMNAIGDMQDLDNISAALPRFLNSVSFQDGHRYADFDSSIDDVAAYGIGALIAGKVLAKTGLLATIGVFLLKAWKLVLVGLVAAGAGFKKLFGK